LGDVCTVVLLIGGTQVGVEILLSLGKCCEENLNGKMQNDSPDLAQ
jgi:hypothetical protein